MAQDVESGHGIAEATGDIFGVFRLDETDAQGFVLALFWGSGLEEETAEIVSLFQHPPVSLFGIIASPLGCQAKTFILFFRSQIGIKTRIS
jgi:hypothetical protein